jgi:hypothetical protein
VAKAAASGSLKDFKRLRHIILVDKSHTSGVILPVVYHSLDPKKIPTANEAAPCGAVSMAALALKTLARVVVPDGAAPDLWPRLWAWFQFLDTHRVNMIGMKLTLLRCALRLGPPRERSALLNTTPGFYTIVGRLWTSLLDESDKIFAELVIVVACLAQVEVSNLEDLAEGAGGSFDDLARLLVRQIDLKTGPEDTPLTERRLALLRSVLIFATRVAGAADDGDGPPNSAHRLLASLIVLGGLNALTRTVCTLSLSNIPELDPAPTINRCFTFLRASLGHGNMRSILPAAVASGLIGCILLCGHRPSLSATYPHLQFFLLVALPAHTVYTEVLLATKEALSSLAELLATVTPELKKSAVFTAWTYFIDTVEERLEVLDLARTGARKTCDNMAVGPFLSEDV